MKTARSIKRCIVFLVFAISSWSLPETWAADIVTDNLTVNSNAVIYGTLQSLKLANPASSNGLKLYYSMKTNTSPVPDDSGNANTGVIAGATWGSTNGIAGGAYGFDGNDKITNTSLVITNAFTANVWFKRTVTQGSYSGIIAYNDDNGFIAWYENNGTLSCRIGTTQLAGPLMVNGAWYMLTLRFDGNEKSMYLNRSRVSVATNSICPVAGVLSFGRWAGWDRFFTGVVDEPRIFNRALSASEINDLYYDALPCRPDARFEGGVSYMAPLGDLSMGSYTNGQ